MKKVLLTMGLVALTFAAKAEQKVYFSEDFEWMAPWTTAANAGDTFASNDTGTSCPNLTKTATVDGVETSLVTALNQRGYELIGVHSAKDKTGVAVSARTPEKQVFMNANYLKFGLTNYFSGMILPKVAEFGAGTDNVSISFDWSSMRQGSGVYDATELVVIVKNGDQEKKFAVPTLNIENDAPFAWSATTVSLDGVSLTKDSEITIRNSDAQWPAEASAEAGNMVYRWFIDNIKVFTGSAAVADLDNSDAPAVYYNLQGARVANPENGVYVCRKGNSVSKVIF